MTIIIGTSLRLIHKILLTLLVASLFITLSLSASTVGDKHGSINTLPTGNRRVIHKIVSTLNPSMRPANDGDLKFLVLARQGFSKVFSKKGIPVLEYHSICDSPNDALAVSIENFKMQMQYLKDDGYKTLTMDELYSYMSGKTRMPSKSVVITFDDGDADLYTNAYPVLKKLGFKATGFIITSFLNKPGYLTVSEVMELNKNGIDIESHTVDHKDLSRLPYGYQVFELAVSKNYLEKLLNNKIEYMAYPYGAFNNDTIKAEKYTGYKMAVSSLAGKANRGDGIYSVHRVHMSQNLNMDNFKQILN